MVPLEVLGYPFTPSVPYPARIPAVTDRCVRKMEFLGINGPRKRITRHNINIAFQNSIIRILSIRTLERSGKTISPKSKKVEALKYLLNYNGDAEVELNVQLNISIDREYVNIELEKGEIVYSLRTDDVVDLLSN